MERLAVGHREGTGEQDLLGFALQERVSRSWHGGQNFLFQGPGFNTGMSANRKGRDEVARQVVKWLPSGCGLTGAQERGQGAATFILEGGVGLPV